MEIFEGTLKDLRKNLRPSKVLVDHFRRYLSLRCGHPLPGLEMCKLSFLYLAVVE